jgi:hypothetical protein
MGRWRAQRRGLEKKTKTGLSVAQALIVAFRGGRNDLALVSGLYPCHVNHCLCND